MNKGKLADDVPAKRAEMLQRMEPRAERDLYDERLNWLRTPIRRRVLVIPTGPSIAIAGLAAIVDRPVISLVALAGFIALIFLLRKVGRSIVDLPDELVDERMRAVRGRVYRYAFIGLMALIPVLFISDILLSLVAKYSDTTLAPLTADQWWDGVMTVFFFGMALPGMIHAWIEPEL